MIRWCGSFPREFTLLKAKIEEELREMKEETTPSESIEEFFGTFQTPSRAANAHCRAQVLNSIVCAAGHVEQHDLHGHVRVFGLGRGRLRPSTHSSIRRGRRLAIWLKASVHINLTGAQGPSCSGPTRWTYADRHTNDDQVRPEQAGGRHCRVVLSLASSSRGPCPVPRGSTSVGACIVALI